MPDKRRKMKGLSHMHTAGVHRVEETRVDARTIRYCDKIMTRYTVRWVCWAEVDGLPMCGSGQQESLAAAKRKCGELMRIREKEHRAQRNEKIRFILTKSLTK